MPKPWLKMWGEWIDDPKMNHLNLSEQGVWWRLVTLAHRCNADGALVYGNGQSLTLDDIIEAIRCTNRKNRNVFDSMMTYMTDKGSLQWKDETLVVTNLKKRQEKAASETPEAVRERVRRFRERHIVTKNPLPPLTTPTTKDREGEVEVESNGKQLVTAEAILAEISQLYERNFAIITPILAEKFKDFVENYRGPVEWIKEAFAEAVTNNVRKWAYVEAILYSWQEKGGPHEDKRERGTAGQRPGAGERDPLASYREQGWEVLGEDEPGVESGNKD